MIVALQTLVFFRESLLTALNRLLSPYYKRIRGTFSGYETEDEEENEEVFAEFDDEKGVVFFPPVYAQRYAAISDCLMDERWCGKLAKVVDLGYHDMSFIKYLKDLPGVDCILGVDLESIALRCSSDLLDCSDYGPKREKPLQVTLFQGNAADPDYRLLGCDAVVAIEMIEHMLPHDLDRLVHTIFGFIKPWVVVITTPNGDFNVLFKSLESNGLRRLDHFFEWTREQFHDWCSNVVTRYPSFTVSCQGVGPGPPGTEHLGCCSQLALFVNRQYTKQQQLDLNSLALVSNVPSPQNLAEMVDGFRSASTESEKMLLHPKENAESLTDLLYSSKQSCVTLVLSSSSANKSYAALQHQDKASQCNLDTEVGKNFIMFNYEDMYYTILKPRRKLDHRVYEIEDVNSRLNCTTFQAKKFSKTTQNLMAKNRIDNYAHTREVVSEIQNLTKMLNFNKESVPQKENETIWCNINWGENAPYWNQYYKVVKEYNYPFEEKSEECRILDLIWEEINRLIDMHCDEEFSTDGNKLQIPLEHLMKAVRHVTNDIDKVKDLLEWNGYEVAGNFVIHSRMVVDNTSMGSTEVDWPENDTASELDTVDGQSTTLSDGSALVPDIHGRCLHRALDRKVQALRKMLSADEDITTELDRVVCRLMKLALRTSKGKQAPPPAKWMQCKLLDLLTLTERAISRRKLHYLESFPKVFDFEQNANIINKKIANSSELIVEKYNHLIEEPECREVFDDLHFGFEDEIVEQFDSNDFFKDYSLHKITPKQYVLSINNGEVSILNKDLEIVSYPAPAASNPESSKRSPRKYFCSKKQSTKTHKVDKISRKRLHSKIPDEKFNFDVEASMSKKSKSNIVTKPVRPKISSHASLKLNCKKYDSICKNCAAKSRKAIVQKQLQPTASKPIPASLIELCQPKLNMLLHSKNFQYSTSDERFNELPVKKEITNISATEESARICIVTDDMEETIALRRSIGTDPDFDCSTIEQEIISEVTNDIKKNNSSENFLSQTIFLYDINEPSTSKGVRHINTDVQCGTDTVLSPSGLLSPPASVTKLPKMYSTGIRIDSAANIAIEKKGIDFGTCTNPKFDSSLVTASIFSKSLKIEDSREYLKKKSTGFDSETNDVHNDFKFSTASYSPNFKLKHSATNVEYFDFGILHHSPSMADPNYRAHSSRSVSKKSSAVMTDEIKFKKEINTSTIDLNSTTDELKSVTPRSPSPNATLQANDSLANLLINFNTSFPSRRATSPIKINKSYDERGAEIKIRDATTNIQAINNTVCKIPTSNLNDKNKIIDLVNEVSIEENIEGDVSNLSSSNMYKSVDSKFIPQEFTFRIKNTLRLKKSPTRDKDAYVVEREADKPLTIKISPSKNQNRSSYEIENYQNMNCENYKREDSFTLANTSVNVENIREDGLEDKNTQILVSTNNFGFKVIDHEEIMKKVEFTMTQDPLNDWTPSLMSSKTEELELVQNKMKIDDSASEFCGSSFCHSPKRLWHNTISSENTSLFRINQSVSQNSRGRSSPIRKVSRNLSCGGVHVHSFKEKQLYEDIVYQGEWKHHAPKIQRKSCRTSIISKKLPETTKKYKVKREPFKQKLQIKQLDTKYEMKTEANKPLRVRNTKPVNVKQEIIKKSEQNKNMIFPNLAEPTLFASNNKTSTKIASKIMTSSITSKNIKSVRSARKPPNCMIIKNDFGIKSEPIRKIDPDSKYLPPYLRKKKSAASERKLNRSFPPIQITTLKASKVNAEDDIHCTKRYINEEIKSELLKVQDDLQSNIDYMVFYNDIEKTNPSANTSQSADITNRNESNRRRVNNRRSSSPISQASSNCSPSDSIATVRANNWTRTTRRHSTSSNKSSIANTDSETSPTANKNRKFSKKCKINKKFESKDQNNKENLPESSKKNNSDKEKCLQNIKNSFSVRSKNLFMAKLEDGGLKNPTKSNIIIPVIESNEEKKIHRISDISKKKSLLSDDPISKDDIVRNQDSIDSEASNLVLLVEPHKDHITIKENLSQHVTLEETELKVVDSKLLTEWFERGNISAVHKENAENAILAQMRQLVEEKLDFIGNSLNDSSFDDNTSQISYKTLIPAGDHDLNDTFKSEIENAMNHSLDAVLGDESDFSLPIDSTTDGDLISFKSVTSTSRYSDYDMAESNTSKPAELLTYKTGTSVLDIYERKDPTPVQHPPGPLAAQAFSGLSMNIDNFLGDQPDYMTIDSEIGPLVVEVNRQATSEEMFVSGRSSETYESCVVEEEVAVPDWLFHVMNPQLVIDQPPDPVASFDSETGSPAQGHARSHPPIDEEEDLPELVSLRLPMVEPVFDVNGNVVEPGVGLGAGAGDGRGMHSDHSQDSSGRGSSLSSTDASSGPQSEAILIDPSAFTTQLELFHESVGSSMAVTTLVVPVASPEAGRQARNDGAMVSTSRDVTVRVRHSALTSDGEADVSSLDTDVPDSS